MSVWMLSIPFVVGFLAFFVVNAVKDNKPKGKSLPTFNEAWLNLVKRLGGRKQAADAINDALKSGYVSKGPRVITGIPAVHKAVIEAITGTNPCVEIPLKLGGTGWKPCSLPAKTYIGKIVRILKNEVSARHPVLPRNVQKNDLIRIELEDSKVLGDLIGWNVADIRYRTQHMYATDVEIIEDFAQKRVKILKLDKPMPHSSENRFCEVGDIITAKSHLNGGGVVWCDSNMITQHVLPVEWLALVDENLEERWLPPKDDECGWIPVRPKIDLKKIRYKAFPSAGTQKEDFYLPDMGVSTIRILPSLWSGEFPNVSKDFYTVTQQHYLSVGNTCQCQKRFIESSWVGECPICDKYKQWWGQVGAKPKPEVQALKPVERYYYNVLVIDPKGLTPKIFSAGKVLHNQIMALVDASEQDISDPIHGKNIKLTKALVDIGHTKIPQYMAMSEVSSMLGTTEEIEKILGNMYNLDDVKNKWKKSDAELLVALNKHLGRDHEGYQFYKNVSWGDQHQMWKIS